MDGPGLEAFVRRRIGDAREMAGFSKRELAARMGMAPSTWQDIETGERPLDVALVMRVAEVCEVSFGWFFPEGLLGVDVSAALQRRYPLMGVADVRMLVRLAELVNADQLRQAGLTGWEREAEK